MRICPIADEMRQRRDRRRPHWAGAAFRSGVPQDRPSRDPAPVDLGWAFPDLSIGHRMS